MLATFSLKMGVRCGKLPSSLLGLCSFSVFWPSWPPLGAIWARFWGGWGSILGGFGLYFGRFWALFWRLLVTIWAYDYSSKIDGCSWKTYPSASAPLGKPALSIHSAGVWFWMGWWGYAKRKEFSSILNIIVPNLPSKTHPNFPKIIPKRHSNLGFFFRSTVNYIPIEF